MEQHLVTPAWAITKDRKIIEVEIPTNWLTWLVENEISIVDVGCRFFIERSEGGQELAQRIQNSRLTNVLVELEEMLEVYLN